MGSWLSSAEEPLPMIISAAPVNEKEQGESASASAPPPPPPPTNPWVCPPNFSDIVADGMDGFSDDQLREKVFKGIYLAKKTKKYWVDKRTNANCFMLFARALSITWGSDTRYWSWRKRKDVEMSRETDAEESDIEVACLKDVCWLEIRGSLKMSHLTPGRTYDVFFVAKLDGKAYGWSVSVDLELKAPNGTPPRQSRKENISKMDGKTEWTDLKVGEVAVPMAGLEENTNMEIAMLRLGGDWKRGLILLGIKIVAR